MPSRYQYERVLSLVPPDASGENDPFHRVLSRIRALRQEVLPLTKKVLFFDDCLDSDLIVINVLTWKNNENIWSLIPIGSILYFWLIVRYGVLSKQNIAFKFSFNNGTCVDPQSH